MDKYKELESTLNSLIGKRVLIAQKHNSNENALWYDYIIIKKCENNKIYYTLEKEEVEKSNELTNIAFIADNASSRMREYYDGNVYYLDKEMLDKDDNDIKAIY